MGYQSRKGTLHALSYVERVRRTLKEEEVFLHEYRDLADARQHIAHFLDDVYMHKRVHSALGYPPPEEFEAHWYAQQAAQRDPDLV